MKEEDKSRVRVKRSCRRSRTSMDKKDSNIYEDVDEK